ncbi:prolyl oligopeptidase family serine peptidase [Streptomyces parvus]
MAPGRGSSGHLRGFHDASYGNLGNASFLEDHVAAIRQLACRNPWIDIDRFGGAGVSGGAFATVRAMLTHADLYKVGVALCGNHDLRHYLALWADTYLGEGTEEQWAETANPNLAANLTGKLLLVHGELDDNVLPYQTLNLVDALIDADKDFDLLIVPGVEHSFMGRGHYVTAGRGMTSSGTCSGRNHRRDTHCSPFPPAPSCTDSRPHGRESALTVVGPIIEPSPESPTDGRPERLQQRTAFSAYLNTDRLP